MITGKISNGFDFAIDETRIDDMRLVDAMSVIVDPEAKNSDKLAATTRASELILGKKQKERLYEYIGKSHAGRVPRAEFDKCLAEIMAAAAGKDAEKN